MIFEKNMKKTNFNEVFVKASFFSPVATERQREQAARESRPRLVRSFSRSLVVLQNLAKAGPTVGPCGKAGQQEASRHLERTDQDPATCRRSVATLRATPVEITC